MPLTIRLEDEHGKHLAELFDTRDVLLRAVHARSADLRLLDLIDPYGDTIFNSLQARRVLADIDRLDASTASDDITVINGIRQLAEKCAEGVHLFLKFYGD